MAEALETSAFQVEPAEAGERLDAYLARREDRLSRSRHKALIKAGQVRIGPRAETDPSYHVVAGDEIRVVIPLPEDAEPQPESIPLVVVYEDEDLIVIDKPAGLVVHPGSGNWNGTLVNALLAHCGDSLSGIGGVRRPGIVHRLDKDTSGLLVVAKNDAAHRGLAAQFADHGREGPLIRQYDALVWGVPDPHIGTVDLPLDRSRTNRQKQAVSRSAVAARSRITPLPRTSPALLRSWHADWKRADTPDPRAHGRNRPRSDWRWRVRLRFSHQVGAVARGTQGMVKTFGRQALHARILGFEHPRLGEPLRFEADWPQDMANLVERFRKLTFSAKTEPFARAKAA
jgi:23S rRNA pseudouridine1911/1915/1917 synthase